MIKPTPRLLMGSLSRGPWHYIKHIDDSPGFYRIYRTARETDLICRIDSEANAAHIVKCVNMHEGLVAELIKIRDESECEADNESHPRDCRFCTLSALVAKAGGGE